MTPFQVVEHLDIVEHIPPGFFPAVVDLAPYPCALEQLEEAFRHGIVMAVPMKTHACFQVVRLEEVLPVITAELAPFRLGAIFSNLPWSENLRTGQIAGLGAVLYASSQSGIEWDDGIICEDVQTRLRVRS